ncbi:AAA family ATPase [Blastopirellula retiformator]|uniref:Uncharacterized protein n=1 Tax=Blastopirellula retiformator TaxID=2527970 RepID=A0A5C5V009_9BACT|nr:AAA family ATPase [Blastopirellula retiformator]TWT31954.1 hypothetical protein Enr8_38800 [Blastopirellula retiformator]
MNRSDRIERLRELLQGQGMFPIAVPDPMIEAAVDRFDSTNKPLQEFTSVELLEQPHEVDWLVPGLLSRGAPAVICGPSKCLKTSLAVDLVAALSTGEKFLGRFATKRKVRVGFFSGEQAKHALTDLTRRWMTSKQKQETPRFVCALQGASANLEKQLRQLRAWIGKYELEVVMIDPLDVAAKTKRAHTLHLQAMIRCCLECGATPILCCATRKTIRPRTLDVTDLQSAGCHDLARQWLLVNRRQSYELGSGQHKLWLTVGGDAGQDSLWGVDVEEGRLDDSAGRRWSTKVRTVDSLKNEQAAREAMTRDERHDAKLRVVIENLGPDRAMKQTVREHAGMNGTMFAAAWERLEEAGEIEKVTPSRRSGFATFQLKNVGQSSVGQAVPAESTSDHPEQSPPTQKNETVQSSPPELQEPPVGSAMRTKTPPNDDDDQIINNATNKKESPASPVAEKPKQSSPVADKSKQSSPVEPHESTKQSSPTQKAPEGRRQSSLGRSRASDAALGKVATKIASPGGATQ